MLSNRTHTFLPQYWKKYFNPKRYYYNSQQSFDSEAKLRLLHFNNQISEHGRNGNVQEAEDLFWTTLTKSVVSWNAMLSVYAKNGHLNKARQLFDKMPHRNITSWNAMISGFVNSGDVREAFQLFIRMPNRDSVSYTTMITGFANAGLFSEAERLYRQTPRVFRDPLCSQAMINGFLKMGMVEDGFGFFEGMEEKDVYSWSSMIEGYCRNGKIGEARKLFDKMEDKSVVTWGSMINGYMKMGCFNEGFELFRQMRNEGVLRVSSTLLTIVLEACGRHGRYSEGCQTHGVNVCLGFDSELILCNVVKYMYRRFECADESRKVYKEMNLKDVISRNSMVSCFVQEDKLERCPQKYFHPTCYYDSQITKGRSNGKIKEADDLFCTTPTENVASWTAMLSSYAKNGQLTKARQIFNKMPQRNIASWNAMISAYVSNTSDMKEAFLLFIRMPKRNGVSYATMIAGFANAGVFREAERLYCQTPREWRDPLCSNVLMNGFLKMGHLEEAVTIFCGMEKKDVVSWSTMIHGYCRNGNLGEARKLFDKVEEKNVVTWVSMINGYMKMGCFNEGFELFRQMRNEGAATISSVLLTTLIRACGVHGRYPEGCQIHGLYVCLGFGSDVLLGNVVITMYWRFGRKDDGRKI